MIKYQKIKTGGYLILEPNSSIVGLAFTVALQYLRFLVWSDK